MYCTHTPPIIFLSIRIEKVTAVFFPIQHFLRLYFLQDLLWPRYFSSNRQYIILGISLYFVSKVYKRYFSGIRQQINKFFYSYKYFSSNRQYSTSRFDIYIFYFACKIKQMTKILLWRPAFYPRGYYISYLAKCSKGFLCIFFWHPAVHPRIYCISYPAICSKGFLSFGIRQFIQEYCILYLLSMQLDVVKVLRYFSVIRQNVLQVFLYTCMFGT